jgi:hypothetical protein
MKFPLLGALLLFAFSFGFSQNKISGNISDQTQKPLPFANVLLMHVQDSSMVKGAVASTDGDYVFENVPSGQFIVKASMVGFDNQYSSPFKVDRESHVKIERLLLQESSVMLGAIDVVGKKPLFEQQMDKMVVNVQSSVTAAGGTALEILARSPGITVNYQANTINMNGKQGVLIMLNGKQMRLPPAAIAQMLSSMSASDIEKIELISNPSSKYDSQGDAGIINIVTKQNLDFGTNGSITLMAGYGLRGKYSGNISINHRTKKFNLYADYSHFKYYTKQTFEFDRTITDNEVTTTSKRKADFFVPKATLQADYKISEKSTVGATVSGFVDNWTMMANNISQTNLNTQPYSTIKLQDHEINNWSYGMANLNFSHNYSATTSLKFDADYLGYADNNPHQYTNNYYYPQKDSSAENHISITKKTPIHLIVLKADFEKTFKKIKYEGGAKAVLTKLNNDVHVKNDETGSWVEDKLFSQQYRMQDQVVAAYSTLSFPVSSKTDAQLGMRAEHTYMNIQNATNETVFHLNFWSAFPTLFLSTKLNEQQKLTFNAGRRITRPSYEDIAPFVVFTDPFTYFSGNPKLRPTFTNNYQVSWSHKQVVISLKYSADKNYIANFQSKVDVETKKTIFYSINIDHLNTYNLNISTPYDFTSWWNSQTNISANFQQLTSAYQEEKISVIQYSATLNSSHNFTLGNGFVGEVVGIYNAPNIFGVYATRARGALTLGLQKELPKNAGKLRLNYQDIFWTNVFRFNVENSALNLHQHNSIRFESRILRLTYSRSFGNNKVKSTQKSTASDDEKYRLKN